MFLAKSSYLQQIQNIANMAKDLKLNVYIWGEKGVGKTFLAKYIAPNAIINPKTELSNYPVIIENFDELNSFNKPDNILIATGEKPLHKENLKRFFDLDIELKPLKEHPEDIEEFINYFILKAKEELKTDKEIKISNPDISENLNSLKRQIFKKALFNSKEEILEELFEYYLKEHKSYEEEIKDFEKTLFMAMRKKYKSKLKISEKLSLNRVTLTKKMKALDV